MNAIDTIKALAYMRDKGVQDRDTPLYMDPYRVEALNDAIKALEQLQKVEQVKELNKDIKDAIELLDIADNLVDEVKTFLKVIKDRLDKILGG